jgi:MFS family permease
MLRLCFYGEMTHPIAARRAGPASTRTLAAVLIGVTAVGGVVSSLGAPLIPSVARSMHVSLPAAQWSLTIAQLTACVAAPIMGRLGDGPRRRPTILGGLVIVLIGCLIAGVADSLPLLILGRALQGVGLGLAPVMMASAREHLPPKDVPGVMGILSVGGAAAIGAGYPISGLLETTLGLHSDYLFGAVMTAAALLAAVIVLPDSAEPRRGPLDLRGAVVLGAGLGALLVAIAQGQAWGWLSTRTLGLFAVAVVALAAWAWMQLTVSHPLVDLRQLRRRAVVVGDLAALVLGVTMYMYLTLVTEFLQEPHATGYGLGENSLIAGIVLIPFSLASLQASRSIPRIAHRVSKLVLLVGGALLIAASGAFFALDHGRLWEALVAMAGTGVGFGYTFGAIPGMVAQSVPAHETGSATGLYQVVRYIGFSIGSALAAAILAGHTSAHGVIREHGYVSAMWVGVAICVASAVFSLLLLRRAPNAAVPGALDLAQRDELAVEEGELAAAGLVGREGD